jgi:hypothetical protein
MTNRQIATKGNKMAKTTTVVIYPVVGFMGATNCVRVFDKSVDEVRSMGRTSRDRFDLAVEVVAYFLNGVATPQVAKKDIPVSLLGSWSQVVAL